MNCELCGRPLTDGKSIQMGMGATCYRKYQIYAERFELSLFPPEVKHDKRRSSRTKAADAGRRADKRGCEAVVLQREDDSARKKKDGPAEPEGLLQWTDGLSCTDA
jgi:hypothetical protein